MTKPGDVINKLKITSTDGTIHSIKIELQDGTPIECIDSIQFKEISAKNRLIEATIGVSTDIFFEEVQAKLKDNDVDALNNYLSRFGLTTVDASDAELRGAVKFSKAFMDLAPESWGGSKLKELWIANLYAVFKVDMKTIYEIWKEL